MLKKRAPLNLLEPIPGDDPCGKFLRYTETYDAIREARRKENEKLPQGVWKIEVKRADWDRVSYLCQDALINQTKDLQIAAWLTEAWLYLEGLPGLLKGLELVAELTKKYWKDLYPQITEENCELRILPYEWMDTKLSKALLNVTVAAPSDKSSPSYTYMDYIKISLTKPPSKPSSAQKAPKTSGSTQRFSKDALSLSIKKTPLQYYKDMEKTSTRALKAILRLEKLLESHLKIDAPNFSQLRKKIQNIHSFITQHSRSHGEVKDMKKKLLFQSSAESSKPKPPHEVMIKSREQAYQILGEIAAYLEHLEPHSPTPYLIQRAIAWGGMSLAEVVQDVLQNGQDLSVLLDLLNIKKNSELHSVAVAKQ